MARSLIGERAPSLCKSFTIIYLHSQRKLTPPRPPSPLPPSRRRAARSPLCLHLPCAGALPALRSTSIWPRDSFASKSKGKTADDATRGCRRRLNLPRRESVVNRTALLFMTGIEDPFEYPGWMRKRSLSALCSPRHPWQRNQVKPHKLSFGPQFAPPLYLPSRDLLYPCRRAEAPHYCCHIGQ